VYGYPDHRHGEVYVGNGTFLNIRAFSLPFGDYSGPYEDNPYELQVVQKPLAGPPEANYMKEAREALTDITARGGGELALSTGRGDICGTIRAMAAKEPGDSVDVVIVLDTTNSMKNDIEAMKKDLAKELQTLMAEKKTMRIGFMLFRDYGEQYLTRTIAFSSDIKKIQASLNSIRVAGGKDIPEAIHEAIRDAAVKMDWFGSSRLMLLITDAPPHLRPRGKITLDDALREAKQRSIKISAILLPQ
jgi:Mg-chelatase subunit ChlD